MTVTLQPSRFAPAERTDPSAIQQTHEELQNYSTVGKVLDAMPQFVALLDENRQLVAANRSLVDAFGAGEIEAILGQRPGEFICCQHASDMPGGCGTSEACRTCGAVKAILSAQNGISDTENCQLTLADSQAPLDLRVTATPVRIGGKTLTTISISDVADQNRRSVLERTFFHDVLNAAGGAWGIANLMNEADSMTEVREFAPLLVQVTAQLITEIEAQRELLAAEAGHLAPKPEEISSRQMLMEIHNTYSRHTVAEERNLAIAPDAEDQTLTCAQALLFRVVGNMTKNALEACPAGGTVTLGCHGREGVCFWVHNPGAIPRDIQLQIFNRSFSTKGQGRGVGTYSIKLLGEKYLGGTVSFTSDAESGTTFRIVVPRTPPS